MTLHLYRPLLRPASFATLPQGVDWRYVEVPAYITKRPDLPTSRWPHGVISTSRPLTESEMSDFSLVAI